MYPARVCNAFLASAAEAREDRQGDASRSSRASPLVLRPRFGPPAGACVAAAVRPTRAHSHTNTAEPAVRGTGLGSTSRGHAQDAAAARVPAAVRFRCVRSTSTRRGDVNRRRGDRARWVKNRNSARY
eukprot:360538-Chlamydomonas_euryale.AAC.6